MLKKQIFKEKLEGEYMSNGINLTKKVNVKTKENEKLLMDKLIKEFISKGGKIKYYCTNTEPDKFIEATPRRLRAIKKRESFYNKG